MDEQKELKIEDIKVGKGSAVKEGDTVVMHYKGTLEDGTKFDSSYDRKEPFETKIGVGYVIKGWDMGVPGMKVGHFENSFLPGMHNFKDLPDILPKLSHLKNKTLVTVCTGGVRCEKASGFLVKNGFKDVYQLYGGIVTYMEQYPNEHFAGSLYVFDNRIIMGFNREDPERKIVGTCVVCHTSSEHYINCRDSFCDRHFICCENCLNGQEKILCPMGCRDYSKEHPEASATI